MNKSEKIKEYSNKSFEDIKHMDENGIEYWYARELQLVLDYKEWRKFENVINKAKENGVENTYHCNSNEEAINLLNKKLQKDDVVLIKASNYMKFTEICEAIC